MKGHILVFDSGLGGTTILSELLAKLPTCSFSYALDNAAFPYGGQTDEFLSERCLPLFKCLIKADQPDVVVIACNTASTLFLDTLRTAFPDILFVGVVPAIKPAAAISQTHVIALLATPATIRRSYITALETAYANECELIRLSHPDLVLIAEEKIRSGRLDMDKLQRIVDDFKQHAKADLIDTFILGCTHFPAIGEELATAWGRPAFWMDSGEAIARRTQHLLQQVSAVKTNKPQVLYLTGTQNLAEFELSLQRFAINRSQVIEIG